MRTTLTKPTPGPPRRPILSAKPQRGTGPLPSTGKRQQRFLAATAPAAVDLDARTVELSFSSELAVERWFGDEVLSHAPGAADLTRLNDGGPLLFNHDQADVLGVVESAEIAPDGKGRAVVRFGRDERGEWAMQQIADGVLRNVSFAYIVNRYELAGADADACTDEPGCETYIATRWQALEISIVTVPADPSVGIGRSYSFKETHPMETTYNHSAGADDIGAPNLSRRGRQHVQQAVELERDRISGVRAACRTYGLSATLEQEFIDDGSTVQDVRALVLERNTGGQRPVARGTDPASPALGLSDREVQQFSLVRAINAQLSGDWSRAGFERECTRAAAQRMQKDSPGILIPFDVLQRGQWQTRAPYQVGTAAQGGNLVATNLYSDQFVDALRNTSQVINAGATVLSGLTGNVDIPRRITTTSTFWVAESGAPTEAEATFDKISLRPKSVGALSKMSRLMLLQATPAIEMLTRQDLMAQIGLAIDLAALSGTGASNQPTGIASSGGPSVVMGANGAAITLDALVAMETLLANSNAPFEGRGYLMNTKTIASLKNLKATTGTYLWTTSQPGQRSGTPPQFNGYNVFPTNQARSTLTKGTSSGVCSELLFGAWSELVIGQWGVLELLVNPYDATGFTTGDVLIRAFQTVDIGIKHGASFSIISDALTP